MYRETVTIEDAVMAVSVMECSMQVRRRQNEKKHLNAFSMWAKNCCWRVVKYSSWMPSTNYRPEADVIRWYPTFITCFNPPLHHTLVDGLTVVSKSLPICPLLPTLLLSLTPYPAESLFCLLPYTPSSLYNALWRPRADSSCHVDLVGRSLQ